MRLFDFATRSKIQSQQVQLRGEMIAQFASVFRDQSWIIEDAMKHLQHLPAEFRRLFEQRAAQTKRMTPDQGAHSGRAAAEDDYIVSDHSGLTERQRDSETERWN